MKMHVDQVDVNADLVARLLRSQFPQWGELPLERFDSMGTVNAIYRLGDDLYVRLPVLAAFAPSLKNEGKWLPRLAPHLPVEVPEIVGKGVPAEGYPFPWAVVTWLDGEAWRADRVTDEARAAEDLARFVEALHSIDATGVPVNGFAELTLRDFDARMRETTEQARDLIDGDALLAAWDEALELPSYDGPHVWVHADLGPDNVLVKDGRLSGVIDWGSVHVGDPTWDVAGIWGILSRDGRDVFREALSVDDVTWARARGWAMRSVGGIDYYRHTNPRFAAKSVAIVEEILADLA